jgi:hypothetical protein
MGQLPGLGLLDAQCPRSGRYDERQPGEGSLWGIPPSSCPLIVQSNGGQPESSVTEGAQPS